MIRRAEEWVRRHLGVCDLGRTVHLDVPHRMHPDLASFVSHLLFAGEYRVGDNGVPGDVPASPNGPCAVEFVPVPPPKGERPKTKRENALAATTNSLSLSPFAMRLKGGAGLELDLSDPRQGERLPVELRADLPNQGFVNYAEAQAVVRTVAALATGGDKGDGQRPTVAVLAMYSAQAELIRRLIRQDRNLAKSGFEIQVGIPSAFRQRGYQWVFLSLTRSHTHRAVTFGEGPHMLALATTRAREKLIIFGDPGTLVRRSQWEGPLEHLDEVAAARERELMTHLVHYLQGQGPHPQAFHLWQGSGS